MIPKCENVMENNLEETGMMEDDNGDLLADSHSILNRW
jgi:hypothetical protein